MSSQFGEKISTLYSSATAPLEHISVISNGRPTESESFGSAMTSSSRLTTVVTENDMMNYYQHSGPSISTYPTPSISNPVAIPSLVKSSTLQSITFAAPSPIVVPSPNNLNINHSAPPGTEPLKRSVKIHRHVVPSNNAPKPPLPAEPPKSKAAKNAMSQLLASMAQTSNLCDITKLPAIASSMGDDKFIKYLTEQIQQAHARIRLQDSFILQLSNVADMDQKIISFPLQTNPENEYKLKKLSTFEDNYRTISGSFRVMRNEIADQFNSFFDFMRASSDSIGKLSVTEATTRSQLLNQVTMHQRHNKKLLQQLFELQGNIRVFIRFKPLDAGESSETLQTFDHSSVMFTPPTIPVSITAQMGMATPESLAEDVSSHARSFEFDKVFDTSTEQEEIFENVTPYVNSAIDGYSVCIFAYGQTGSGKTYTMEGTPANRGIQFQALRLLFETVKHRQHQYDFELSVSAVEIYNEMPRDLFVETEIYRQNRKLELREDQNGHVFIPNLTTFHIESLEEVYDYLEKYAYKNRQMAHTNSNEVSSRSHCLLFVNITATNKKSNEVLNGKLILIDLAGSERVKKSNAAGQTLNEAKHINRSLSALGDVMNALRTKAPFVPYRNSKLTYLLSEHLSGQNKICMIACVNLSPIHSGETLCTLQFANRIRNIQLGMAKKRIATLIEGPGKARELAKAQADLQIKNTEVSELRSRVDDLQRGLSEKEERLRLYEEKIFELQERLKSQTSSITSSRVPNADDDAFLTSPNEIEKLFDHHHQERRRSGEKRKLADRNVGDNEPELCDKEKFFLTFLRPNENRFEKHKKTNSDETLNVQDLEDGLDDTNGEATSSKKFANFRPTPKLQSKTKSFMSSSLASTKSYPFTDLTSMHSNERVDDLTAAVLGGNEKISENDKSKPRFESQGDLNNENINHLNGKEDSQFTTLKKVRFGASVTRLMSPISEEKSHPSANANRASAARMRSRRVATSVPAAQTTARVTTSASTTSSLASGALRMKKWRR